MFRWAIEDKEGNTVQQGDWGYDVRLRYGGDFSNVKTVTLFGENNERVTIYPHFGVINIDIGNGKKTTTLLLSTVIGGYLYSLFEEAVFDVIDMYPLTTASFDCGLGTSSDIERMFVLCVNILKIRDKLTGESVLLSKPVVKKFYLRLDAYGVSVAQGDIDNAE